MPVAGIMEYVTPRSRISLSNDPAVLFPVMIIGKLSVFTHVIVSPVISAILGKKHGSQSGLLLSSASMSEFASIETSTIPAPSWFVLVSRSYTVASRIARTSSTVAFGYFSMISAAAPVTCGTAADVPLNG